MIQFNLDEMKSIKEIMDKDNNDPTNAYLDYMDTTYVLRGENSELYMRSSYQDSLIIARIEVCHKHIGVATKLFEELFKYTQFKGFKKIMVESVMTPEMHEFCIKNNFKEIKSTRYDICCNYEKEIAQ